MRVLFLGILLTTYCYESLAQRRGTGLNFDDAKYQSSAIKARLTRGDYSGLPTQASLKQFSPDAGNQMQLNTSVGWAISYAARTILEAKNNNITDKREIRRSSYSPVFNYAMAKTGDDINCEQAVDLSTALESLKSDGVPKFVEFLEFCPQAIPQSITNGAKPNAITGYSRLFDIEAEEDFKVRTVKKAIAEGFPVVVGMRVPPSFDIAKEFWQPREKMSDDFPGHAMTVIGYDDSKYGGSFEVLNSWGQEWGNNGFMWIPYQYFTEFVRYGYEIFLIQNKNGGADLSGELKLQLNDGSDMPVQLTDEKGYYKVTKPFYSGTLFRIIISNNETAFIYAFGTDLSNKIFPVFPFEDNMSPVLAYQSNHIAIPSEEHFVEMDDNVGKDFLCVLYSREEIIMKDVYADIESGFGSFRERVFAALEQYLLKPQDVDFDDNKIKFSGTANGKSTVAMIVEIDHH